MMAVNDRNDGPQQCTIQYSVYTARVPDYLTACE